MLFELCGGEWSVVGEACCFSCFSVVYLDGLSLLSFGFSYVVLDYFCHLIMFFGYILVYLSVSTWGNFF